VANISTPILGDKRASLERAVPNLNHSSVGNLLELRNHYRIQQLENEQRKHYLSQQLMHIDALLVDHLESSNLMESLIELRHQYQQQVAECDRSCAHSKDQLTHVNALLADQIVEQHEHPTLRAAVEQRSSASALALSLTEASKPTDDELSKEGKLEKGLDEQAQPLPNEMLESANSFQPAAIEQQPTELEHEEPEANSSSSKVESVSELEEQSSPQPTENSAIETETFEESSSDELPLETPLLPLYQQLTKPEALRQLMEEKAESALHIDWLLRELYGELTEEQTLIEKARLSEILNDGVEQGRWEKVPGAPECYIINHKLVEPELAQKTSQKQQEKTQSTSSRQPGLTVLPKYSGASLIDAVELILAEQAGEKLTIEQVTKTLYGKLTGQKLSRAKEVVRGALKRGVEAKRWQRVAGQKGVYTLETKIVKPAPGDNDAGSRSAEKGQAPLKFLPAYAGMSFIDAAGKVLQEHLGKVMTTEQVARVLYGDELSGVRLSTARHKVNRVLWEGANRKKWRRLTGVMGRYTLDLN